MRPNKNRPKCPVSFWVPEKNQKSVGGWSEWVRMVRVVVFWRFWCVAVFGLSRMKKMGTALLVSQPFWQLLKGATGKDKLWPLSDSIYHGLAATSQPYNLRNGKTWERKAGMKKYCKTITNIYKCIRIYMYINRWINLCKSINYKSRITYHKMLSGVWGYECRWKWKGPYPGDQKSRGFSKMQPRWCWWNNYLPTHV